MPRSSTPAPDGLTTMQDLQVMEQSKARSDRAVSMPATSMFRKSTGETTRTKKHVLHSTRSLKRIVLESETQSEVPERAKDVAQWINDLSDIPLVIRKKISKAIEDNKIDGSTFECILDREDALIELGVENVFLRSKLKSRWQKLKVPSPARVMGDIDNVRWTGRVSLYRQAMLSPASDAGPDGLKRAVLNEAATWIVPAVLLSTIGFGGMIAVPLEDYHTSAQEDIEQLGTASLWFWVHTLYIIFMLLSTAFAMAGVLFASESYSYFNYIPAAFLIDSLKTHANKGARRWVTASYFSLGLGSAMVVGLLHGIETLWIGLAVHLLSFLLIWLERRQQYFTGKREQYVISKKRFKKHGRTSRTQTTYNTDEALAPVQDLSPDRRQGLHPDLKKAIQESLTGSHNGDISRKAI